MRFRKSKNTTAQTYNSLNDKYESLIQIYPFAIVEVDGNIITYINGEAKKILSIAERPNTLLLNNLFRNPEPINEQLHTDFFRLQCIATNKIVFLTRIHTFTNNSCLYRIHLSHIKTADKPITEALKIQGSFQMLINQSAEGICILDDKGTIIDWNQAMSDLYQTDAEKYLNKPIWEFDFDYMLSSQRTNEHKKVLRTLIQTFLLNPDKTTFNQIIETEINGQPKFFQILVIPIETSIGVFFIRINIDVSETRASEKELEDYKEHLEDIIQQRTLELQKSDTSLHLVLQSVPIAFYSFENNNRDTIWYSKQIESLSGFKIKDLKEDSNFWVSRINKDDFKKIGKTFDRLKYNERVGCEYRWKDANGKEIWIYDQAVRTAATNNIPEQIVGCFIDITDRKDAETSIRESEWSYREIFNSSSNAIFIHNAETGAVEDVNKTMLSMYKTTYNEALKSGIPKYSSGIAPYDNEHAVEHIKKAQEKGICTFEWQAKRNDGSLFWTDVSLKMAILGGKTKIIAIVHDIDEKKLAEELINYQSEFEKLILDISSRFVNISIEEVNEHIESAFKEICNFSNTSAGYFFRYNTENETVSLTNLWQDSTMKIDKKVHQNVPSELTQWYLNQLKNKKVIKISDLDNLPAEATMIKKILTEQNLFSLIDVPLFYQNRFFGFMGIGLAQTGRTWLNEEISLLRIIGQVFVNAVQRIESVYNMRKNEQTYREIYNTTTEAILILDLESGKFLDVNDAALIMFDLNYKEALQTNFDSISSGEKTISNKKVLKLIKKLKKQSPQIATWQALKKDKSIFWVEMSINIAEIRGKNRALVVLRDITEQKIAAEKLKENEEKYRMLVESQTDLIVKLNPKGKLLYVSRTYCEMFDKTEQELLGKKFLPMLHEEDKEHSAETMKQLYKPPYSCSIEQRALTKNGWRWLAWNNKAILDEDNEVVEIISVGRDITYQKGVEEALRHSEDRFRSIVQHLSDIVLICDKQANIIYDTPSVKTLFGYNEGYLIGRKLNDYIYTEDQKRIKTSLNKLIQNENNIISTEFRVINKSGKIVPVEGIIIDLLDHPSVNGMVVTLRDITERKITDKKILDAVIKTEEQERERFAKNLHDDLGPLLSSIKMYTSSLNVANTKEKQEFIISQLQEIVKESITTTKEVSNDLSPHILNNYGLVSAIENFCKKIPTTIKVNFNCSQTRERYANIVENSLYRISKELINNTLKHANATEINISLNENGQELTLLYTDNGKGIDMDLLKVSDNSGMGISNIISRAKSLNGQFEFTPAEPSGFSFRLSIPIHQVLV